MLPALASTRCARISRPSSWPTKCRPGHVDQVRADLAAVELADQVPAWPRRPGAGRPRCCRRWHRPGARGSRGRRAGRPGAGLATARGSRGRRIRCCTESTPLMESNKGFAIVCCCFFDCLLSRIMGLQRGIPFAGNRRGRRSKRLWRSR